MFEPIRKIVSKCASGVDVSWMICSAYFHLSLTYQGVGGIIELAPGYFPAVYNSIKKAGGLCIADKVQSRFAHTGSHFWGFETQGIVPDIVTMAKVNKLHEVC
ncbi:alanine--glyoxylate aminotransferase 2 homolog 3, mitochondrial-like isoform X2 [Camellia sinensis]|uniref:alanine--glyoxylate aminotransferase 2 homolog 3, mitochondrial-like isoform X2 n=1 Tax=Camellia sinensis TaxID=4442 RepID=UPI00103641D5|nr:alanine--glyoxylate aminotransferase 2 homolog 3, mitochondrial-like isoform X2 [Camellia sinensis]